MALDSSQHSLHDDDTPVTAPVLSAKNGASAPPVDPNLLRWRAEVLLDEMMLGGVDLAAGEPVGRHAWPAMAMASPASGAIDHGENGGERRSEARGEPFADHVNGFEDDRAGVYANGQSQLYDSMVDVRPQADAVKPGGLDFGWTQHASGAAQALRAPVENQPARPAHPEPEPPTPPSTEQWVANAEERYRRLARQTQPAAQPADPPPLPAGGYGWPDAETQMMAAAPAAESSAPDSAPSVRRVANRYAGGMTVTAASAKRSNLLPRMSNSDVEAVEREIATLQSEVDVKLPPSHESNERAHHLLEKALTILQADPLRTAEVEYYLQQVRTIFQRVQQTRDWSSIYRGRLLVYVAGWSLLGLIVLLSCYLYPTEIEETLLLLFGISPDGALFRSFVMMLAAVFGGALGGALSVFISLRHQARLPHGFIDRKFGLRGLILPVIGAVVGGVLALFFAAGYTLAGVAPGQHLLLAGLPTFFAFLFGVNQESLYGTRD